MIESLKDFFWQQEKNKNIGENKRIGGTFCLKSIHNHIPSSEKVRIGGIFFHFIICKQPVSLFGTLEYVCTGYNV